MALCGCGTDGGCGCEIQAGSGISVSGTGEAVDPFIVSATGTAAAIEDADTATVSMHVTGDGSGADPVTVSADVRLDPSGGLTSSIAGVAVAVDETGPNALTPGPNGLRVVPGAVDLDPDGALESGPDGLGLVIDPIAGNEATIGPAGLRVVTDFAPMTHRINVLEHITRAQRVVFNQGAHRANLTQVSWVNMMIIPPMEQLQSAAYYNVAMPPAGTVVTGMFGAPNATVVTNLGDTFIPLGDWQTLWYLLPTASSTATSSPSQFRVCAYGNAPRLPDNAILIAWRSGMEDKEVHWADGSITVPWRKAGDVLRQQQSAPPAIGVAINLGSAGTQRCSYRRVNNVWEVEAVYAWAGTGIAAPGGGSLYQAVDFAAPGYDVSRTQWDRSGTCAFWTADNGAAPNRGYKFSGIAVMPPLSTRIYFEVPAHTTAAFLERMRIWDGAGGSATAFPNVGRALDTSGSRLEVSLRVPAGSLPQP